MKTRDRLIGIALGILLGLGIVTAFVFLGSESTIDAPGVSGSTPRAAAPPPKERQAKHEAKRHAKPKQGPAEPSQPRIATVRVIGGAPPTNGPAHLDYATGEAVRLRILSDQTVDVELVGLGLSGTVHAGRPTLLAFKAKRRGNYPLTLTASHIAVAQIRVGQPAAP